MRSRLILSNIILFVLALISFLPQVRVFSFFNQLWAALMILWLLVSLTIGKRAIFNRSKYRIYVGVFVLYTVLISYFFGNGVIGNRFLELSQLYLFYIGYEINKFYGFHYYNKRVIYGLIPFIVATCLTTIRALLVNPFASRDILERGAVERASTSVGGYGFIYFIVVIFCSLLFYFGRNSMPKKHRLTVLSLLGLLFVTVLLSNFMTGLLLCLFALVMRIFFPRLSKGRSIIIVTVGVFIFLFFEPIIVLISDAALAYLGDSLNASRVKEIRDLLIKGNSGASVTARADTYSQSFQLFLNNPFFGIIINPIRRVGLGVSGFGQHSQVLDTFALFGFLIGTIQVYLIGNPIAKRINFKTKQNNNLPLIMLIVAFSLATVNNLTPSIGFAIFFIFPVIHDEVLMRENKLAYV